MGLSAAVSFFQQAGRATLQQYDEALARYGLLRLREVPGLRIIGPTSAAQRVPVFPFTIAGYAPAAIADHLNKQGIAVRAGDMAALPLLRRFGVSEAVRASAYVYTTHGDIDRLADGLRQLPRR